MNGWIKLHRKIWQNPVVTKDSDHLAVWIYLLTHATHQEHDTLWKGQRITLKPGQLITGRKKLSKETGIEQSKVVRVINLFKSEQQIEQQTSAQGSLISILAWDKYQISEQPNEQRVNSERTASEHQMNTKTNNKMNNVDNSPNQVKSKVVGVEKNQSEQQNEQPQIVYDSKKVKKVNTIQENKNNKKNNNHQEYIYAENVDNFHFETNADRAGMSLKDFIRAKAKGEIG